MKNLKDNEKIKKLSEALRKNLKRRKINGKKDNDEKSMKNKSIKLAMVLILSGMLVSCGKKTERVGYFLNNLWKGRFELLALPDDIIDLNLLNFIRML